MVKRVVVVFVILFAIMNIYAQSVLEISSNSADISKANTQIKLTLTLSESIDSTLYVNMPEKMTAVPIAIQNNSKNLWLKNGVKAQPKEGTVSWDAVNNILKFNFFPGELASGDVVIVDFMVKYHGKQAAEDKITVKKSTASAIIAEVRLSTLKR